MKLFLTLAAAFGLVVCRVQALFDPDVDDELQNARRVLPHSRSFRHVEPHKEIHVRDSRTELPYADVIFDNIKNSAQTVASWLDKAKKSSDKMAYTNLSELLSDLTNALNKFGNNVGLPQLRSYEERSLD